MRNHDSVRASLYADGQLDGADVQEMVREMRRSPELRREVDEIRDLKLLMKQAFPLESASPVRGGGRVLAGRLGMAAALVLAFVAGWLLPHAPSGSAPPLSGPVVLHVPEGDPQRWARVLDLAERLGSRHVRVDVLANADGLRLFSAERSPYRERIRRLAERYPELAFVACANGLARMRARGESIRLLAGVDTAPSAVEHVAERVAHGWRYLRL